MHALRVCVPLAALFTLTGCFTYDESAPSRGSLSGAMHASAGGGGQTQSGYGSQNEHEGYDDGTVVGIAAAGTGGSGQTTVDYDSREYQWQVLGDVAYLMSFSSDFRSLTRYTLTPVAIENKYNSFGLFLAGDTIDLKSGSLPDLAVDSIWMFETGLFLRRYFSPPHTFLNPYATMSVSSQLLLWSYRNPVISDGDTITSDELGVVGGYVGVGLTVLRNKPFSFFGEVGVGGTAFLDTTVEGFDNDVFKNFGYFSVKAGPSLKF